jgi:hypothetical protein
MKYKVLGLLICTAMILSVLGTGTAALGAEQIGSQQVSPQYGPNPGPQTWQLDSEPTPAGYQMERTAGSGDNGQTGEVPILINQTITWIADEVAGSSVTFSSGTWSIEFATESDWGTEGDNCEVTFGKWTAGVYSSIATLVKSETGWDEDGINYIFKLERQIGAKTIPAGSYLAVQITNNDSTDHTIYTGEYEKASCIKSPQTDPGYPLPEMAAGLMLGLGVAGLAVFVIIKRRKTGADSLVKPH